MIPPIALTIAGSDSGGGAGIQADLRTFAFHRVHGTCAITCVTAQNTLGVTRVDAIAPEGVTAQLKAVLADLPPQALKTGMLLNAEIMEVVAQAIAPLTIPRIIDPVMVSRTGAVLIDQAAIAVLRDRLLPLATVLTPNRYEAQLLAGMEIQDATDLDRAAQIIQDCGPQAVLIKGGAATGDWHGVDWWWDGQQSQVLKTEAIATPHTHGSGCTLAAAIAANAALGLDPLAATQTAKTYVTEALRHSLAIGHGQGPLGHFYSLF
ncbi:bifunctional hydroxymethylpyrimidine kinase/phosphomethylpyrimidine kinase [Synechococcus elongatus]|uniref:Bifunctional hydroxymethylpyrimidine kinase/phosphomethylpyrimidine kinase n=1 Tax=Synechococcus elongatus PCC 11801 TaxID=2219813 RepID=A0AAN1QMU5_SYNEL|nr:bifunctional hydroxymethylpyrimidine kinase/phosphomethylpyrimidine kinase [Synechococcus elongatus]AZB72209.1 bifunctional hydroxymethylpyrimidine kinase/phosphomethylpyrimidine kinase [Synechococcus elongatus PCC 11801]